MPSLLAFSLVLFQGWPTDPSQSLALASGPMLQQRPVLAASSVGTTWFSWVQYDSPYTRLVLRAEHLDSEGRSLLASGPIELSATEWQYSVTHEPSIVALADGSAVMVRPRANENVVTRISESGAILWEHPLIAQPPAALPETSRVAPAPGSGALVLLGQIAVVELASDGTELRRVALAPGPNSRFQDVRGDATGVYLMGLGWGGGSMPTEHNWLRKVDWSGAVIWSRVTSSRAPALDGAGRASWAEWDSGNKPVLVRSDPAGTLSQHQLMPASAPTTAGGRILGLTHEPASLDDLVTYVTYDLATGSRELRLQRVDPAGQLRYGPAGVVVMQSPTFGAYEAVAHYDPLQDQILVVWIETAYPQTTVTLRAAGFDGNGSLRFAARDTCTTPSDKFPLRFAPSSFGGASIAVWQDGPYLNGDVHATCVRFDGDVGPSVGIGRRFCAQPTAHSGGQTGRMLLGGSARILDQRLLLRADQLVPAAPTLLLASRGPAATTQPVGSVGTLCLGSPLLPVAFDAANASGALTRLLDPTNLGALAGEAWCFQAWFRDTGVSRFTDAVAVTLR